MDIVGWNSAISSCSKGGLKIWAAKINSMPETVQCDMGLSERVAFEVKTVRTLAACTAFIETFGTGARRHHLQLCDALGKCHQFAGEDARRTMIMYQSQNIAVVCGLRKKTLSLPFVMTSDSS